MRGNIIDLGGFITFSILDLIARFCMHYRELRDIERH